MVYFKYLFQHMEDLSPVEGLVYSELLLNSLLVNPEFKSGALYCKTTVELYLAENFSWDSAVRYYSMKPKELTEKTELTYPTVRKTVMNLEEKGYIRGDQIRCPLAILNKGYIKIPYGTGLKGQQLIFYAFLLDRSYRHEHTVDTWAYRFKELCGISEDNVYFIVKQLKAKGLVQREKNKLVVLKPKKKGKAVKPSLGDNT